MSLQYQNSDELLESKDEAKKCITIKADPGNFTYDDKHSSVVFNFEFYQPVDTQQIYLDVYVLE